MQTPAAVTVRLDHLDLDRSGRAVLRDISWSIRPGERWLVLGANGAGKTQLLKVVAGDVWPNPATVNPRHYQPQDGRDEIVYVGPERQDRHERYGWNFPAVDIVGTGLNRSDIPLQSLTPAQRRYCVSLLRRAGIASLAKRRFLTLSYGERRLVLLARAWAWRPALLLLDEAATGLDAAHRGRLHRFLSAGRSRIAWVCTSHRAEDAPAAANRLLLLDRGRVVYRGPMSRRALLRATQAAPRSPRRALSGGVGDAIRKGRAPAPVVFSLRDANVYLDGKRVLSDLQVEVRRGDCWVVHGANGSGKSTLLRTIYGDHGVAAGGVINRAGMSPGVPLEVFRRRTALVSPQLQSDYPAYYTVVETVVSGLHSSIGLNAGVSRSERKRAAQVLRQYGLENTADRPLGELSYGQRRRVLFARAIISRPRVLLLDEPFSGLDATQRGLLLQALERQVSAGMTIILATHYRTEWPRGATHELHLSGGRVAYAGTIRE